MAVAVHEAAKRLECLYGSKALDGVVDKWIDAKHELDSMQCTLKEAEEDYNHDAEVNRMLSRIREFAIHIQEALDLELMTRRRSVFERVMLLELPCIVDGRRRRIGYVLDKIWDISMKYLFLQNRLRGLKTVVQCTS